MAIPSLIERSLPPELLKSITMGDQPDDLQIDFADEKLAPMSSDDATVEFLGGDENDGAVVTFGKPERKPVDDQDALDHYANLASFLSESDNFRIADDLIEMIEADTQSMEEWELRLKRGLEVMGVVPTADDDLPFEGAANVNHPLIAEAIVQFNARAGAELMPPAGPCKGYISGQNTQEARERADRMESHMNYQMTEEDAGYYDEMDSLLMYLPYAGSAYTKTYWDDNLYFTTSRFVRAENVKVPYTATSLENSPRYTIMEKLRRNEIKKRMASGFYREVNLAEPMDESIIETSVTQDSYDEAEGRTVVMAEKDARFNVGEMNIEYDLPGFEDKGADGQNTGIGLPYLITVDVDNRTILSIRRNWRETDANRRRLHYLSHYKYLPGTGFLGFGVVHILGGLAIACTDAMRAILDSAQFATLQGGFKSKDAAFPPGEFVMKPGEWQDVDLPLEDMQNAFYTPPFKEPSMALFKMLELMEQGGRRFAGTTEAVVGDAASSGPVGTTVALIEQGTKVMSGVHKRLHRAQRREFAIRARINAEFLPQEQIYYDEANPDNFISGADYADGRVRVIPVSDPNIISAQQRIAQAQALVSRSDTFPQLYRQHRVEYRLLEALDVDDADQYIRDPDKKHRCDAVGEASRLMGKMPIWAFPDQSHEEHIAIHMAQIEYFKTLPEEQAGPLIMQMTDHLAKHEAYRVYAAFAAHTGQQMPEIDLYDEDPTEDMPAEVERMVTTQAARFVQGIMQEAQTKQAQQLQEEEAKKQAAIQALNEKHAQELANKQQEFEQTISNNQKLFDQKLEQQQREFEQREQQQRDDANPNSAQESIMRSLSDMRQTVNILSGAVSNIVAVLMPGNNPDSPPIQGDSNANMGPAQGAPA